jgi:hypothetical protein
MQIKFESWLATHKIGQEAVELFEEAIKCYRASAYKAALLFSYLGFQTILKNRIMASSQPPNFRGAQWNQLLTDLNDDDAWDHIVYQTTQQKNPRIYDISDSIRIQATYWKDRRNDCAHSKQNIIEHSHVVSYWLFIESNLPKFVVIGSQEEIINRIKNHFDYTRTPPGEDFQPLLNDLPNTIADENMNDFFSELETVYRDLGLNFLGVDEYFINFLNGIPELNNERLSDGLVNLLKKDDYLLVNYLIAFPMRVNLFSYDPPFIRNLWHEKIYNQHVAILPIICALLSNNLIPDDQVKEAMRLLSFRYQNEIPNGHCHEILLENGFYEEFRTVAFEFNEISNFNWANRNRDMVAYYITIKDLDPEIVYSIHVTFSAENHPWHLRETLNQLFRNNEQVRNSYLEIAANYRGGTLSQTSHLEALYEEN